MPPSPTRLLAAVCSLPLASAGSFDVSSARLWPRPAVDDVKLSWDKELSINGQPARLWGLYDVKANKNFLSTVSLTGALPSTTTPYLGEVKMGYDLTHSFKAQRQTLKLNAASKLASLKATLDANGVQVTDIATVSKIGDVSLKPLYKPPSGILELTMAAYDLAATVSYNTKRRALGYKLAAMQCIGDGRDVVAQVQADGVELYLIDSMIERGAKWTATLSSPFSKLRESNLQLRRSVSF